VDKLDGGRSRFTERLEDERGTGNPGLPDVDGCMKDATMDFLVTCPHEISVGGGSDNAILHVLLEWCDYI